MKTAPWIYKFKNVNGEKTTGRFYEKELLRSILKMSYYPEPNSHIRDKVNLDLTSYATKKKLEHATGIDKSDSAAKKILLLSKLKLINQTLTNWLMFQLV